MKDILIADGIVICSLKAWLEHGKDILQQHPEVQELRISDKRPMHCANGDSYWNESAVLDHPSRDYLPQSIFDIVAEGKLSVQVRAVAFESRQHAMKALAEACLAWAKKEALR